MIGGAYQPSQVVAPPQPAAGGGFTYKISIAELVIVRSVAFTLVNAAAVAARLVSLDFLDGTGVVLARASSGFTTATGITTVFTFAAGINVYGANDAAAIGAPIPELVLVAGQSIRVNIGAVNAADQISNARVVVDQYGVVDEGSAG